MLSGECTLSVEDEPGDYVPVRLPWPLDSDTLTGRVSLGPITDASPTTTV